MEKGAIRKREMNELKDEFKVSANVRFTDKNESKFFKLIGILVKNSDKNLTYLNRFKHLLEYKEKHID